MQSVVWASGVYAALSIATLACSGSVKVDGGSAGSVAAANAGAGAVDPSDHAGDGPGGGANVGGTGSAAAGMAGGGIVGSGITAGTAGAGSCCLGTGLPSGNAGAGPGGAANVGGMGNASGGGTHVGGNGPVAGGGALNTAATNCIPGGITLTWQGGDRFLGLPPEWGDDSQSNPTLTLCRGFGYTFHNPAVETPFYIKRAFVSGPDEAYSEGVYGNGTEYGDISFLVPADAPDTLYYASGLSGPTEGGMIIIVDPE